MMHFKNRNAFTLLETVFALAIAATVLTPLFIVQSNILHRTSTEFAHWERMLSAINYMYTIEQDPTRTQQTENEQIVREKKIDDPVLLLRYSEEPINKKSSLKDVAYLKAKQVTFSWEWNGRGYQDTVVTFASTLSDEFYYE